MPQIRNISPGSQMVFHAFCEHPANDRPIFAMGLDAEHAASVMRVAIKALYPGEAHVELYNVWSHDEMIEPRPESDCDLVIFETGGGIAGPCNWVRNPLLLGQDTRYLLQSWTRLQSMLQIWTIETYVTASTLIGARGRTDHERLNEAHGNTLKNARNRGSVGDKWRNAIDRREKQFDNYSQQGE